MKDIQEKARIFRELHSAAAPLVLFNVWDAEGARILQELGCAAIATSSAGVARALGSDDGEKLGREAMLEAVRRIASCVEVPVTADLEGGYGATPRDVGDTVMLALDAGAVGMNIEDGFNDGTRMRPVDEQCERIAAARAAADARGVAFTINARIDVFLSETGDAANVIEEAIRRARAYRAAGADCLYPIALSGSALLRRFCSHVEAPVNVYAHPGIEPIAELTAIGVRRVSFGPFPFRAAMNAFREAARTVYEGRWPWPQP